MAYANPAFRNLSALNGAPFGTVIDRPLAEVFNPAAAQSLITLLDTACHEGTPVRARFTADQTGAASAWQCAAWSVSVPANLPDQQDWSAPMVVQIDASSYSDRDEAQHRDLTELVLLSAIREEARAVEADAARSRAEQARVAQNRFLAEVSHEIRTPMQAIVGYAKLIEMGFDGPVTGEQRETLTRIDAGSQHVIALIGELLQYTTSAAQRIEYAFTKVEVKTAMLAAESLVAPQAHERAVALNIAPDCENAAVRADAAKLLQVVLNLLANAVKFTGPGGTITISWEVVAAPDGRSELVAIRVADTGRGIASSELALVFDPYIQVGERGWSAEKGVGLGLAISRELARGMGGDLTATSTPGVGSVFTLTLPGA